MHADAKARRRVRLMFEPLDAGFADFVGSAVRCTS
jgi:hypothetical protein